MTQTLRRELRLKFLEILSSYLNSVVIPEADANEMVDRLADAALGLRGFSHFDPSKLPLDWKVFGGIDFSAEEQNESVLEKEATNAFESDFGFGTLPWSQDKTWEKFYKFVIRIYMQDKNVWKDYIAWRNDKGKYSAYSNRKIRENPQAFMDTGYPEFEASKMYADKPKSGRKYERLSK